MLGFAREKHKMFACKQIYIYIVDKATMVVESLQPAGLGSLLDHLVHTDHQMPPGHHKWNLFSSVWRPRQKVYRKWAHPKPSASLSRTPCSKMDVVNPAGHSTVKGQAVVHCKTCNLMRVICRLFADKCKLFADKCS